MRGRSSMMLPHSSRSRTGVTISPCYGYSLGADRSRLALVGGRSAVHLHVVPLALDPHLRVRPEELIHVSGTTANFVGVDPEAHPRELHFVGEIVSLPATAGVDVFGPPAREGHRPEEFEPPALG